MIDLLAEPPDSNIAWQLVKAVLPTDAESPLGRPLQVFTSTLFFLGGLYIAYGVIVGIVASSYHGKVLGQRWHQIWVPLRIILGAGLLAPLPSTGFSSVHYILRDVIARAGINLADASWNVFVSEVASGKTTILPASSDGSTIALTVLRHEVCAAVYNRAGSTWGWQAPKPDTKGSVGGLGLAGYEQRVTWSYGPTCGRLSFSVPDGRQAFSEARRAAVGALVDAFRPEAARYAQLAAETTGLSSPEAATKAVTDTLLSPRLVQDIRAAGAAYDTAVIAAAKEAAASVETEARANLVADAKTDGFMGAGAYFRGLTQVSELTTALANERPEEAEPRLDGDFGDSIGRGFAALRLQISGEPARSPISANDFAAAGDDRADSLTKALAPVARDLAEWAATPKKLEPGYDAMSALIGSGQALLSIGWSAIAAGGVVAAVSGNSLADVFGAGAAGQWFLSWTSPVIIGIMGIGALRAYLIPILPFIFILMSGVALVAALLEAMIALPLWCLKWLKMDNGDDFAGESVRMGILLTVNIFLRPSLAILAFCGSYPVFNIFLRTLDQMWAPAFLGQSGGSVVGLVGFLVMTCAEAYMTWYLALKLFGQSWSAPDKVLAWLGLPGTAGESSLASGAVGGMLALAGRGSMPRLSMPGPSRNGKLGGESNGERR
ncbi:DotA/TraY family protein [Rhizobium leguminosarum]|uniref:DotA/TraY family protein n=1 Tax=Rhizobium leguminosarum TaxID=384 RepID=UPI001C956B92|nr:DotA/TraY family protein [Rhizobium leguminosarum]MBY5826321.1 DotA/TraY family protein [Rhizobium leguminosarum]